MDTAGGRPQRLVVLLVVPTALALAVLGLYLHGAAPRPEGAGVAAAAAVAPADSSLHAELKVFSTFDTVTRHAPWAQAWVQPRHKPRCFLFFAIQSSPQAHERRNVLRRTWLARERELTHRVCYRFFVTTSDPSEELLAEVGRGDLVLLRGEHEEDFAWATARSCKWAVEEVDAQYVALAHDDVYVCTPRIVNSLESASREKFKWGRSPWGTCSFHVDSPWPGWFDHQNPFFLVMSQDMVAAYVFSKPGLWALDDASPPSLFTETLSQHLIGRMYNEHEESAQLFDYQLAYFSTNEQDLDSPGCRDRLVLHNCHDECVQHHFDGDRAQGTYGPNYFDDIPNRLFNRCPFPEFRPPVRFPGSHAEVLRSEDSMRWMIANRICQMDDGTGTPPYEAPLLADRAAIAAGPSRDIVRETVRERLSGVFTKQERPLAVLAVITPPADAHLRDMWRRLEKASGTEHAVLVRFMVELPVPFDPAVNAAIDAEKRQHGDIITLKRPFAGARIDGYDDEFIMAILHWTLDHHPNAEFFAYAHADTFISIWRLEAALSQALVAAAPIDELIFGNIDGCTVDLYNELSGPLPTPGFLAITLSLGRRLAWAWPPLGPDNFQRMVFQFVQSHIYALALENRLFAWTKELSCTAGDPILIDLTEDDPVEEFHRYLDQDQECREARKQDPWESFHSADDETDDLTARYYQFCQIPPFAFPRSRLDGRPIPHPEHIVESLCHGKDYFSIEVGSY